MDENFLSVFDFNLLQGDKENLLADPNSIILTQEKAIKYFGEENPIGQTLIMNGNRNLIVTGVIEKAPLNSTINYDFILPFEAGRESMSWMGEWDRNSVATYLLMREGADIASITNKIDQLIDKHYDDNVTRPESIYFMPLEDMYLNTIDIATLQGKHFAIVAVIFFFSGLTILIIVGVNYVSLSTSRFMTRAKEIGLRKVLGANRSGLVKQFLTESVIISFCALPLGVVIYYAASQYFSLQWSNMANYSMWNDSIVLLMMFGMVLLVGVIAGLYPALFLSSFNVIKTLKGTYTDVKKGSFFKKVLLSSQFVLSIVLIIFSIALNRQFHHVLTANMGYNKDNILTMRVNEEQRPDLGLFQDKLEDHTSVVAVSGSNGLPCHWEFQHEVVPEGSNNEDKWTVDQYAVDYSFIELYEMKILQGRSFVREYKDDKSVIVNETAAKRFGWDDPIGKRIKIVDEDYTVVGVVKDFLF